LIVGVDLDGVLGDQIADVLPRIKARLGIELTYAQILEFRLPLGSTDLAREIELAQEDDAYLLDMPLHEGAREVIRDLRRHHRLVLITARPSSSRRLTERWLEANGLEFDAMVNALETKKSVYGVDVLIDDYTANIADFVQHTEGLGILLSQPWNQRDREGIRPWINSGQAVMVRDLPEAARQIETFASLAAHKRAASVG
jgi:5'(3')-deoxyribonucleotidase